MENRWCWCLAILLHAVIADPVCASTTYHLGVPKEAKDLAVRRNRRPVAAIGIVGFLPDQPVSLEIEGGEPPGRAHIQQPGNNTGGDASDRLGASRK